MRFQTLKDHERVFSAPRLVPVCTRTSLPPLKKACFGIRRTGHRVSTVQPRHSTRLLGRMTMLAHSWRLTTRSFEDGYRESERADIRKIPGRARAAAAERWVGEPGPGLGRSGEVSVACSWQRSG